MAENTAGPIAHRDQSARQVVASFDDYADAERAVDHLSDAQFDVSAVAIIGRELQYVEQVVGRLDYASAAWRGAAAGAVPGAVIGWIFGLFNWIQPLITGLVLAGYGLILGAALGAVIGVALHALQRGRRDFHAVAGLQPEYYDVVADVEVAQRAREILTGRNEKE